MNDLERTSVYQRAGSEEAVSAVVAQAQHIGRYRVEKILGQGGFGPCGGERHCDTALPTMNISALVNVSAIRRYASTSRGRSGRRRP